MGRYHFNVRNGSGYMEDEEGQQLSDPEHARAKAVEGARSLLSAEVLSGDLDLRGRIEVTDEKGEIIFIVDFQEALRVKTGEIPSPGGERQTQT
jgi:hypothetical protein